MASDDYPWEPPIAGTEAEALVGALDRLRTTFRWKADDLDAAGLQTRIPSSALTLGGLLKHLARAEDEMFTVKLSGAPRSAPWDGAPWDADPDWDFTSAAGDSPDELYALWDSTVARSRATLAAAIAEAGSTSPSASAPVGSMPTCAAGLRPHRGVRPAHGARRPAPRGGRRTRRRGPAGPLAPAQPGHDLPADGRRRRGSCPAAPRRRRRPTERQGSLTAMGLWDDGRRAWERLDGWDEGPHPDDGSAALAALSDIGTVRRLLDQAELSAVRTARRHGKSWAEIATRLGVTGSPPGSGGATWTRSRGRTSPLPPRRSSARARRRLSSVVVPSVIGMSFDQAVDLLTAVGLVAMSEDFGGVVTDQTPEAGRKGPVRVDGPVVDRARRRLRRARTPPPQAEPPLRPSRPARTSDDAVSGA
jgi:hypothetical protein